MIIFKNIANFRKSLSVSLTILLLAPLVIKLADGLFHHHETEIRLSSHSVCVHQKHDNCPIPGFEFSTFSKTKVLSAFKNVECYLQFNEEIVDAFFAQTIAYSFHLRAPPRV